MKKNGIGRFYEAGITGEKARKENQTVILVDVGNRPNNDLVDLNNFSTTTFSLDAIPCNEL